MQILCHNYVAEIPSKKSDAYAFVSSNHHCRFYAVFFGVISYFGANRHVTSCLFAVSFFDGGSSLHISSASCVLRFFVWRNGTGEAGFWGNTDYTDDHGFFKILICENPSNLCHLCSPSTASGTHNPQYSPTADPTAATNAIAEKTHIPTVKELFLVVTMSDFFPLSFLFYEFLL